VSSRHHPGVQLAGGGEHDAGLAERGQHLADVAQERGVRADDEHAALLQLAAVGVEQVGGAVQRDGGLAGAGATLHDHHALLRGADDPVLLTLDGLHDVGHPAGAAGVQRGQQRRLAGEALVLAALRGAEVEHLVVETGDLAAPGPQVAPAADAFGGGGGGEIERPRGRCPPVQQQRLVVVGLVPDAQPADIAPPAVVEIEPAETQPVLGRVELGDPLGGHSGQHVPLGARLRRAAPLPQCSGQPVRGPLPQAVEVVVEHGDVLLLVVQFLGRGGLGRVHPGRRAHRVRRGPAAGGGITGQPGTQFF